MQHITKIGPFTRMFLTLLVAAGIYFILGHSVDWHVRLLIAWCGGALFFLAEVAAMFSLLDAAGVKRRCQGQHTEGHGPMLVGGVLIALVSIAAVIYLLKDMRQSHPFYGLHLGFSILTIFSSWLILQTMFAIYYARLYYQIPAGPGEGAIAGGLRFTSDETPDYWDFLYFSFTLAMCYSVSDIAVTSKFLRRITLVQTQIAFFYYTVIIGLVMNLIGTLF